MVSSEEPRRSWQRDTLEMEAKEKTEKSAKAPVIRRARPP